MGRFQLGAISDIKLSQGAFTGNPPVSLVPPVSLLVGPQLAPAGGFGAAKRGQKAGRKCWHTQFHHEKNTCLMLLGWNRVLQSLGSFNPLHGKCPLVSLETSQIIPSQKHENKSARITVLIKGTQIHSFSNSRGDSKIGKTLVKRKRGKPILIRSPINKFPLFSFPLIGGLEPGDLVAQEGLPMYPPQRGVRIPKPPIQTAN